MKGKLRYYYKCEETINSIEGWVIYPIREQFTSICYQLAESSIHKVVDLDKSKIFDVDFKLLTNCKVDDDGFHVSHNVVAEIDTTYN